MFYQETDLATVYYLPGTTGWGTTFGGRPTAQWNPFPTILSQPQNQTVFSGESATFSVSATGSPPLSYQWRFAGMDIPNATNSIFTIPSAKTTDAGTYSVIITNAYGTVASSNALLTVSGFLFIAAQPQSQTVGVGSNVTFDVTVYGAPPFVFQWYFNGTPLGSPAVGTNFLSCTLTNVGTNQTGNYSVQVFNGYGSVTSSNAAADGASVSAEHHGSTVESAGVAGNQRRLWRLTSTARLHLVINGDSTAPTFLTPRMPFTQFPRSARTMPGIMPW